MLVDAPGDVSTGEVSSAFSVGGTRCKPFDPQVMKDRPGGIQLLEIAKSDSHEVVGTLLISTDFCVGQ